MRFQNEKNSKNYIHISGNYLVIFLFTIIVAGTNFIEVGGKALSLCRHWRYYEGGREAEH